MNTAKKILEKNNNNHEAIFDECENLSIKIEQDFENETSTYVFDDDSILKNCNGNYEAS